MWVWLVQAGGEAVVGGWCGEVWPAHRSCLGTGWRGEESGARSWGGKCWALPSVPRGPVAVLGERPPSSYRVRRVGAASLVGGWVTGAWGPPGSG